MENEVSYLNYSIDNAFVLFRNQVYKQIIGIPYDVRNDASRLANIFLHIHKKTFFQHLQDNHQQDINLAIYIDFNMTLLYLGCHLTGIEVSAIYILKKWL